VKPGEDGRNGSLVGGKVLADPLEIPPSMSQLPIAAQWILLTVIAFVASTLAAISGFGGAAVLLPALIAIFGVREAIPILTVAQLIGNGSRVWFNRSEVNWPVIGWFTLGSVPLGLLGGYLFATVPFSTLTRLVGVFLLFTVVWRHARAGKPRRPPLKSFAVIGAGATFLSALVGSVGPIMAPFFLAYGLVKGAYIGTEAMATVVMHITKLVAYHQTAVLTVSAIQSGLALGPIMVLGSFLGKRVVDRLPERLFVMIIEAVLIIAGLMFLIRG
jgi:uncharacterized membrane protein YfcA